MIKERLTWEEEILDYVSLYIRGQEHYATSPGSLLREKYTLLADGAIERRKTYLYQTITTYGYKDCSRCYGTGTCCSNPYAGVQREYKQCPDCFQKHFG